MAKNVIMPALGMAQETGVLLQWLKAPGDTVSKGEPLMEIETDKATVEVEAPASGVLANVEAAPGDEIPVGEVLAVILAPDEATEPAEPPSKESTPEVHQPSPATFSRDGGPSGQSTCSSPVAARIAAEHNVDLSQVKPQQGERIQKADVLAYLETQKGRQPELSSRRAAEQSGTKRPLASPKARRLAAEHGLELSALEGRGPEGAVLAADVLTAPSFSATTEAPALQAAEPAITPAATLQTLSLSRVERIAAERLSESWATVPHFYLVREVQAGRLISWRAEAQTRSSEKITLTDLLVRVIASALRRHPRLNARWYKDRIALNPDVNIGLAVAVERGLVVPVIHRADTLGLTELAARRKVLVEKARADTLSPAELRDGTFTVSNLGMYGVDAFNAIINPPQAAILAISRVADRVVAVDGKPAVQPMLTLSLSCDHRMVDGAKGAQFLQSLAEFIEAPTRLIE